MAQLILRGGSKDENEAVPVAERCKFASSAKMGVALGQSLNWMKLGNTVIWNNLVGLNWMFVKYWIVNRLEISPEVS